jgi:predicted 3-demethylubiquinone-9 3-methyltransferase (glyoxalase superfamily)
MPTFDHSITPMLWFDGQAEEAARLYVSVFPDSSVGAVTRQQDGTPLVVELTLAGHRLTALNGGPQYSFTPAVSLVIDCETQEEVDNYWDALSEGGPPEAQQCGWLADRFGVSWQVVPRQLTEFLGGSRLREVRADHAGDAPDEEAGRRGSASGARRGGVSPGPRRPGAPGRAACGWRG